ncbi:hypothetical protein SLA2020_052660 [Shorea laevis]
MASFGFSSFCMYCRLIWCFSLFAVCYFMIDWRLRDASETECWGNKSTFVQYPPMPAPPIPTKPVNESAHVAAAVAPSPPPTPKSSPEKTTPFINVSFGKSSKVAALQASGASNYVLVSSPMVCGAHRE